MLEITCFVDFMQFKKNDETLINKVQKDKINGPVSLYMVWGNIIK